MSTDVSSTTRVAERFDADSPDPGLVVSDFRGEDLLRVDRADSILTRSVTESPSWSLELNGAPRPPRAGVPRDVSSVAEAGGVVVDGRGAVDPVSSLLQMQRTNCL